MQKSILFAKVESRLGLIQAPNGETNLNIGVENAPEYILTKEFINQFPNIEEITFQFTAPEKVKIQNYYDALTNEYTQLINEIIKNLNKDKILITVGGDHSISLGSVAAILKIYDPLTTGMIMIDSHADIHQASTSPSGNFHGMWVRPIVDKFEIESIDKLVEQKLPTSNLFYIGNLDTEPEEQNYMQNEVIEIFSKIQIKKQNFINKLENSILTMEHIHVSIDIDVFSHEFAPATGMMIKNGLSPDDIFPILSKLKNCKSLSIDLVEVNPKMDGSKQTIKLAQAILRELIN